MLGFLWYDAVRAFFFETSDGSLELGVGLGSLVLLANVICPLGVHVRLQLGAAPRRRQARLLHLLARGADAAQGCGSAVGRLNLRHMEWAWISLASVAFADLYIRLAASGVFHDPRIF